MIAPLWVLAGIATAVAQSFKAYMQKKLVGGTSGLELSFIASLYTAILLLPVAFYYYFLQGVSTSVSVWIAMLFVEHQTDWLFCSFSAR